MTKTTAHLPCSDCFYHPFVSIRSLSSFHQTVYKPNTIPSSSTSLFSGGSTPLTSDLLTDLKSSELTIEPPITWTSPDRLQYHSIFSTWQTCSNRHQNLQATLSIKSVVYSHSPPFSSILRHAEKLWKRTHCAVDWCSVKSPRNQYHKLILSSKKEYYSSLVSSASLNSKVFGKQSTNVYTASPLHRYPPLFLSPHLQTASLHFSQARYPNFVFLSQSPSATLLHHDCIHRVLLPLPGFLRFQSCFEIWNLQDFVQLCKTSNLIQISSPPNLSKNVHPYLFQQSLQYCQPLLLPASFLPLSMNRLYIHCLINLRWIQRNSPTTGQLPESVCRFQNNRQCRQTPSHWSPHFQQPAQFSPFRLLRTSSYIVHPRSPRQCNRITESITSLSTRPLCCFRHYSPWQRDHPSLILVFASVALFSAGSSRICHFVAFVLNEKPTGLPSTHLAAVSSEALSLVFYSSSCTPFMSCTHSKWTTGAGGYTPVPSVPDYRRWWMCEGIP